VTTLRFVHRWLGLLLAVVIFAVAASGGLLLLRDPYYRLAYPPLRAPIPPEQTAARAAVLSAIELHWQREGVQSVMFPRPGANVYLVRLLDGSQAFVHPVTGAVIDRWRPLQRLPSALFELHAHLFAKRPGTTINGILGLAVVFLVVTGFILWWPVRGTAFLLRHTLPRGIGRMNLLRSHAAAGVLASLPILLFVVTGIGMAFYQPTARVVSRMFDRQRPAEPDAYVARQPGPARPWAALLAAVDHTFADGETVYYYPGTADNARLLFRKRLPGEWHPNGRSYVVIDPYTGTVVQAIDARQHGAGTRAMNTIYPLHAARVGGVAMTLVGTVASIALSWLAISGVWCYVGRRATRTAAHAQRRLRGQTNERNSASAGATRMPSGVT
jgi:uncharacterized iron-regulated membrane protein